jgi:hypothetical protein
MTMLVSSLQAMKNGATVRDELRRGACAILHDLSRQTTFSCRSRPSSSLQI